MYQRNGMIMLSTSGGANITCLTGPGYFGSIYVYASAASGQVTLVDGTRQLMVWSGTAGATLTYALEYPGVCTSGLSVTGSGAAQYNILFATQ